MSYIRLRACIVVHCTWLPVIICSSGKQQIPVLWRLEKKVNTQSDKKISQELVFPPDVSSSVRSQNRFFYFEAC